MSLSALYKERQSAQLSQDRELGMDVHLFLSRSLTLTFARLHSTTLSRSIRSVRCMLTIILSLFHHRGGALLFLCAERRRRLAMQAVEKVTGAMLDGVNGGVAEVFANQRRIEEHSRLLQSQTTTFSKQVCPCGVSLG
jgi:GCN5-like protein 1 (GCN5L1)